MALFNPPGADYYADLGLQQQATAQDIKTAFRKLAILNHPDKLGPGQCDDAHEFRKAREAYECLIDPTRRAAYDENYYDLQNEWTRFRLWQETQNLGAEEMAAKYEEDMMAAKANRARQKNERQKAERAQEEDEYRQWRADMEIQRQAAERSRQAGEVSPSEQHRIRRDQNRKKREREEKKKKFDELCEATKAAWNRLVIERDAAKKRVKQLEDVQDARLHRIKMEKEMMRQRTESYKAVQLSLLKAKLDLRRLRTDLGQHTAELRQKKSDLFRLRNKLAMEIRNDMSISMSYHRVMKEHLRLERAAQDQMMKQRLMARAWDSAKKAWIKPRDSLLPDSAPDIWKPIEGEKYLINKPCSHTRTESTKSRSNDVRCRRCGMRWFFWCPRCHEMICMICQGEGTFGRWGEGVEVW